MLVGGGGRISCPFKVGGMGVHLGKRYAMTILQKPADLNLSGNLPKFVISSSEGVDFLLKKEEETLLSARYIPGQDNKIIIDIKDVVESSLFCVLKDQELPYIQNALSASFSAEVGGQTVNFRVVKAGVDRLATPAENFLRTNWLTWQPQEKHVTYYVPEFLTFYAVEDSTVKVKAHFFEGGKLSEEVKVLYTASSGSAYTVPVQYGVIVGKFGSRLPSFYDVWFENSKGVRLSYIQRYVAGAMLSEHEDWVVFENSLGGLDTFRAYGQTELEAEHTHNLAELGEQTEEYRVDTKRNYQKSTGWLDDRQRKWLLDFFPSQQKYIYTRNFLRRIVVSEDNTSYVDKELPTGYSFTYRYADAKPLLNLARVEDLPADLHIDVPELGSFTIPPRLVEFPSQNLSEGVLFPVQDPHAENWATTTIGAILQYVTDNIITMGGDGTGGVGHTHNNFSLLQGLQHINEYLTVYGQKIKAGYADKAGEVVGDKYLRKDKSDQTNYLLRIGEFIDSMLAGKGTGLYPDGRIQTDRLEVRGSMTVMDLIINELHAMAGDYSFSDFGKIERVEEIPTTDGNRTYKIWMEKELVTDVTNFEENDVLYSIVNNLRIGGTDYYTSWFRPVNKNTAENSLTVVLYPDTEVPGAKNYPPAAGYNVTRRGNAIIPDKGKTNERAQSWMISSREGRIMFLQNVFKPILEDFNYALTLGKLPNVKAVQRLGLEEDIGLYAQTVVCEKLYKIDWNGDIVSNKVDRGLWSLAVAQSDKPYRYVQNQREYPDGMLYTELEQHSVYHYGCKWGCLVDKTTEEPKWNSGAWVMLEGDTSYNMSFESTNGWQFFVSQVDTIVSTIITHGNRDITNALMSTIGVEVEWLRDTGNPTVDATWRPHLVDGAPHVIHLTNDDMGMGWGTRYRRISITCKVFIPVGEEDKRIVTNSININI